jgi:hypothetical protein
MTRVRVTVLMLVALAVGVILGGYLFSDTRPRLIAEGQQANAYRTIGVVVSLLRTARLPWLRKRLDSQPVLASES